MSLRYYITALLVLILCSFSTHLNAQNFNRPTPPTYKQYEFQRYDTTDLNGYYLFCPHRKTGETGWLRGISLTDQDGYLVWWSAATKKHFDFKYHPIRQQYSFSRGHLGDIYHYFMNHDFDVVDSMKVPSPYEGDIHEVTELSNGNICVLAKHHVPMDLSTDTFSGVPGSANTTIVDMVVVEFDSQWDTVFVWRAREHFPIDMYVDGYPYNVNAFDYIHANSIEEDFDGNLLLSFRTADACVKINRSTGAVIWILGGNYNQFNFVNDGGFLGQHDIRRLPNGDVSLFDNQFLGAGARGVQYTLDEVNMTATRSDEYTYDFPVNAPSQGNYSVLDNGYSLVGWGSTSRPMPSVTLVDPNGTKAADFLFEDVVITYRAFFQELDQLPARPQITCDFDGVNYTLTSDAATYYLWSTGESTQSITVADTGTYQVWVNQGVGMLGSEPFFVTDLQDVCGTVAIEVAGQAKAPEIVGYCDLMGRSVKYPQSGQLYLVRYSDGTVRKSIFQE